MNITKKVFTVLGILAFACTFASGQVTELLAHDRTTGEIVEFLSVELPRENIPHEVREAFDRGEEIKTLEILVPQFGAEGTPVCYLRYKLDRCFIKSWSTSGDADDRPTEEVAFYYNKIAFEYVPARLVKSSEKVSPVDALLVINF